MDVDALEMTIRSSNALRAAGISTIDELVAADWHTISQIPNIGKKSAAEIAWTCVRLLSGRLREEAEAFDAKFPHRDGCARCDKLARKLEAIRAIAEAK